MKRFKKFTTTFLTTLFLACNTITSPGFNVWAQEEKIPIDSQADITEPIEQPVDETTVPEETIVEEPVINDPVQNEEAPALQPEVEEPVEQEQDPAFEKTVDVKDGPTVNISAPERSFPEGIQVEIQKVDVNKIYDRLHAQDETIKKDDILALDFDFYKNNEHNIEPNQKISITIKDLEVSKDTKASLYHMEDENTTPEKEDIKALDTNNKQMTFESDSFSIHALILFNDETNESTNSETTETPEQPTTETEKPSSSTDLYESTINLAPGSKDSYYGGEIITVYDNISISGNNTIVPEGAYTVLSLPKTEFQKPRESDVSTSFDNFKRLEIKETDTDYQVVLTYKTLYGGYNGGSPIRVNLLSGKTVNESKHLIKQEFYNKDGKKLTPDNTLTIKGKAVIESLISTNFGSSRLKDQVDSNFVIKEGTFFDFHPGYSSVNSNQNDPRDRRLYATIPEGTKVKENTGWTYEKETNRYYKDISRSNFTNYTYLKITLDLGGIDLSNYDATNKTKKIRVNFSVQPVVDGVVQKDLGPYTTYSNRPFYILKEEPKPDGASTSWGSYKYERIIDKNFQSIDGSTREEIYPTRYATISYNKDYLYTHRMRYTLKNIYSWYLNNANNTDEDIRELIIKDSRVDIGTYVEPNQIRIMVIGLNEQDAQMMKEKLAGTKAYGIKADGSKILISENVPIHIDSSYSSSFDAEDWQTLSNTEDFIKVEFVYPNGGVVLKGKDQINRCKYAIYSDVIGRIKESTYETLKNKLDAHQYAEVWSGYQYGNTSITSKYYKFVEDTELTSQDSTKSPTYTNDYIRMQNEKILGTNSISITNGSQFFTNDTITTTERYRHYRYGNFSEATTPDNLNIYYLVPDGLEPVQNPDRFESIEMVRGYKDGMNLVVAKPKSVSIPKLDGTIERSVDNWMYLDFTATSRLDIGEYTIYSCMSYDNNKIGMDARGQQYGIFQNDTPSGVWSTILKDANNRPDDPAKFTNFNSTSFRIYPPKVLSALKQVKLSSESDSKYASSLGSKATIGDSVDYRLVLKNNSNSPIDQIELFDVLPYTGDHSIVHNDAGEYPNRGSQFKTPLVSAEASDKFEYYYSTDPVGQTSQDIYNATWLKTVDDYSKVTMIKAVLKEGKSIAVGENAYIVTHNQIENDSKIQDGNKAYNSFAYTLNKGNSFVEALRTEVQVTYPKRDVLVEKVNAEDASYKLFGAVFNVYEEGTGENGADQLILSNISTNHDGIATLPNLLVGKEYYLQESTAPEGYVKTDTKTFFTVNEPTNDTDVQKIVIKNDVPRTTMNLSKVWIGAATTSEVTVHILANGKDTGQTAVLKAVDDWKTTVKNLPVNDKDGNPLTYSVEEEEGENYTSSVSGDITNGFVITNTNTETRDVSVSKTWVGPKQDEIQITLVKDGTPTKQTLTLNEENNWNDFFKDLIKYDPIDGHEIAYTVQEAEISDYTSSVSGDMVNGFILTNTNVETISLPVTKTWIGPEQGQAEVILVKDGNVTEQKLVLNADNAWKAAFNGLTKYDPTDGHKIEYTIQETPIDHYTSNITGSMDDGFTVTNTNTETVSIPVEKHWIGPMKDSVEVTLVKDGEDTKSTVTLNADNAWKASFDNLIKYDRKDGHAIQYTVKEAAIKDYTSNVTGDMQNGFVITNTNTHTISIPVQKVWVGPALDSVEVSLVRDGKDVVETLTLSKEGQWQSSFSDLPEYDPTDGHKYVYSLQEMDVPNYKSVITGTQNTGFTITNTITGKVSVGVTKQWIGKGADSVTLDLMNGDQKVDSVTLSDENNWQHTFTDLDQYDENGHAIAYTIHEKELDGYTSTISGDMNSGYVVINTNTETISIPVTKSWKGPKEKQAEINLYRDGTEKIKSVILSETNHWASSFTDLPVYDAKDGHKINYTIQETPIDSYKTEITGDETDGYQIINTNVETMDIPVQKQWIGPSAAEAEFTLLQDGQKTGKTLILTAQDQWKGIFKALPKYSLEDGHAYRYSIVETKLAGYDSKIEGDMNHGFIASNTNTELVNIPVEKQWIGPETSKAEVVLIKDGIETEHKLILNGWNHWKDSFNNLLKYDAKDGHKIQYAIKEIPIKQYSSQIKQTENGYVITNTNIEKRAVSIQKNWVGPKTDSVQVSLYADGKATGNIISLSNENEWKASFDDLEKYDSIDGHEIEYSVKESKLENYDVSITGNMNSGFTITNTNRETLSIPISKVWIGPKQDAVKVTLIRDGQTTNQTLTLNEDKNWSAAFKDLSKYDADGHEFVYTVQENEIPNYSISVTGDMTSGFTITNTNTETISIPVEKEWIGPAASQAEVTLLKDGKETDQKLILSEKNHWKDAFNTLSRYDATDGHEIVYSIKETPISQYESKIKETSNGYKIINTNVEKRSVTVKKNWIGPKVDQVHVSLYADDKETGKELVLNDENAWQASFDDLNMYDSKDGHEIVYSVKEEKLLNYSSSVQGDMVSGFSITNTNVSKRKISVVKKWIGQEGSSATVILKQDGQVLQTVVMTKENHWKYEFEDLPRYDKEDGHEIEYIVEEQEQPGYTSVITGNVNEGFVVTNTQIQNETKDKDKTDTPTKKGADTSEKFGSMEYIVLAITSALLLMTGLYYKRKQ